MDIFSIGSMLGFSGWQMLALGGMLSTACILKTNNAMRNIQKESVNKKHELMKMKQKEIEIKAFNEDFERRKAETESKLEAIKLEDKERKLKENSIINATADKVQFKQIKPPCNHAILLGYDSSYNPNWGTETNYIVGGNTGCGKTRRIYGILLNFLLNKQGVVFLCDLKGMDFPHFKDCKDVKIYVDDIQDVLQAVNGFKEVMQKRKELFNKNMCVNIDEYNEKFKDKPLREFMLVIDEYSDIASEFSRSHKPIGVYKDIVDLSRKCRAFGGRVLLGTQRPSSDNICGSLKCNYSILGMRCLNELNSKIMLDSNGCEKLKKTESLIYIDGELKKLFSYYIGDNTLKREIAKLK